MVGLGLGGYGFVLASGYGGPAVAGGGCCCGCSGGSSYEAEISREEFGIFTCYVEKRFPDDFFVACVAHVCHQLQ